MSAVFADMMILCPAVDILQTANWSQQQSTWRNLPQHGSDVGASAAKLHHKTGEQTRRARPGTIRQAYSGLQKDISPIMRSEYCSPRRKSQHKPISQSNRN